MEYDVAHQSSAVVLFISHADEDGYRLSNLMGCPCMDEASAMQVLEETVRRFQQADAAQADA